MTNTKEKKEEEKPTTSTKEEEEKPVVEEVVVKIKTTVDVDDLEKNCALVEHAVNTTQWRLLSRAMRKNTFIRQKVKPMILSKYIMKMFPENHTMKDMLLALLLKCPEDPVEEEEEATKDNMDVVEEESTSASAVVDSSNNNNNNNNNKKEKVIAFLPEIECYLTTLVVTTLLRYKLYTEALELTTQQMTHLKTLNRRTLDNFKAKAVFYYSFSYEKLGRLDEIRSTLLALHRTACLQHDEIGQATILNLLLRNLLCFNRIDQAYNLVIKTNFPESASNNQFCRYLFYMGKIQAIQLDYSAAYTKLQQASRKVPQNTALAFRTDVQKLLVIVQLLLGEIPERSVFNQKELKKALLPYFYVTQTVRHGDLLEFNQVIEKYSTIFKADGTFTLILRLGHNVVKTGLRKISISYSRISLADISAKLHLESAESAEFVVAKAIKDGVIEAVIDHETGTMQSKEVTDVYATNEPQQAFHKRITFCLDVHNEAVKAMRYPPNAYKKDLKDATASKDDDINEEELAKELEEEMDDF